MFRGERFREHRAFVRNGLIATGAGAVASLGFAELVDYLFKNPEVTSVTATVSDALFSNGVFWPLHYFSNKDKYTTTENKFNYKPFITDIGKAYTAGAIGTVIFYGTFTTLNDLFLRVSSFRPVISTITSYSIATLLSVVPTMYLLDKIRFLRQHK